MLIKAIIQQFLDYVYPPYCAYCRMLIGDFKEVLCTECLSMIQPVVSFPLKITATCEVPVFSIGTYKDPLKVLITSKQYRDRQSARDIGHLLWKLSDIKNVEFDYIVPVPLHWSRYAYRWYNQADEIAYTLSRYSGKPVIQLLKRKHQTPFQAGLSREERSHNVKHVFELAACKQEHTGKRFLLVDDVLTTGATVTAAIKTLRILQPIQIVVAVGCRVI